MDWRLRATGGFRAARPSADASDGTDSPDLDVAPTRARLSQAVPAPTVLQRTDGTGRDDSVRDGARQQPVVLLLDDGIALAAALFESGSIEHADVATAVADQV